MANPFEPPRAVDAAAPVNGQPASTMPEAAVAELVASAPWVRWAARLAVVSIIASLGNAGLSLARASQTSLKVTAVAGVVIGVPIAVLLVMLFRRYAGQAERLRERQPGALPGVVDAQRALFKTYGIFTIVMMALVPLAFIVAVLAAVATKGAR